MNESKFGLILTTNINEGRPMPEDCQVGMFVNKPEYRQLYVLELSVV
jgi:hypothetical protein